MKSQSSFIARYIPVMLCFFAMGFVDLVGIASNYVKADLSLTDSQANIFPSLVFFWFLIFSVPTGILMNRIGRKNTVLLSLVVTFFSLVLPIFGDSYLLMLASFSLLGIGNALMQTSLNPLLSNVVSGKQLASALTLGQFVKAIASFLAPYVAVWGATQTIPSLGLGWRVLFPIYAVVALVAVVLLSSTSIREEERDTGASGFMDCLKLLRHPFVLLCFLGAFILSRLSARKFFGLSVLMMLVAMLGLFVTQDETLIDVCIALIGFGNSNIFPIVFSQALLAVPERKNEVSGLMIMGLFGGTLFPLCMGVAADAVGQTGAVAVMTVGVIYLLIYTLNIKTIRHE